MKVKNIKTIEDMQYFVEGCLNDFEAGVSTKEETLRYLKEFTFHIINLTIINFKNDFINKIKNGEIV